MPGPADPFQGYHHPLIAIRRLTSTGTTNHDLSIGPVPPGRLWVINWVAVENETTNFTYVRVLIGGLGEDHHLLEERTVLAANLYWYSDPIYLPETRTLVARFNGTTSGDRLAFYANGFEVVQPAGA